MLEEVDITYFHRCCTCDRRDRRSSEGTLPRQTSENKFGLKSQTNYGPVGCIGAWCAFGTLSSDVPDPPSPAHETARDDYRSRMAKARPLTSKLMASHTIGPRIAWWPMHKISRVRQIERMEHAFRPVGLKGSRERPARLTVILNYLEKVCCRP